MLDLLLVKLAFCCRLVKLLKQFLRMLLVRINFNLTSGKLLLDRLGLFFLYFHIKLYCFYFWVQNLNLIISLLDGCFVLLCFLFAELWFVLLKLQLFLELEIFVLLYLNFILKSLQLLVMQDPGLVQHLFVLLNNCQVLYVWLLLKFF